MTLSVALSLASAAVTRLAVLGSWPSHMDGEKSIVGRIPQDGNINAPGFDAGLACALGLIPENKQRLAAILHGAYTPEAVAQVRTEAVEMDPDSETCWWLAACSVCREGGIDETAFTRQIEQFEALAADPAARRAAAIAELAAMGKKFTVINGVPFVTQDGGLQGAYVAGYNWGVEWKEAFGIFFIGTFRPSLGLEKFPFSDRKDGKDRPMSGPVWGSQQYVKASDLEELGAVVKAVRAHLGG